jgi:acylphosphatase
MSELTCARVLINGLVQGVGFRYFVTSRAVSYEVCGYVRNLDTGGVEIEVEGTREEISKFLTEMRRGPRHGLVTDFQIEWKPFKKQYDHFFVKY